MDAPFIYKGDQPLLVSAETVFATVKTIIETGREEDFLKACKDKGAGVMVAPEFVNLVKLYLFKNDIHKASLMARELVSSARCTAG